MALTGYTPEHPLVLVTDFAPEAAGGGAVILRSLLRDAERARIAWLSLSPTRALGAETLCRGPAGRVRRRSLLLDSVWRARALADTILGIAQRRGARALWVVMHGAAVHIAAHLVRAGALPVHLTVHDDPAYANALRSRKYLALVPYIARDFAYALRHATSVDVIGEGMAERYRRRYGVRPVIIHRGLEWPIEPAPPYERARGGLSIGLLGSTYSYSQLPVLARAVERAARRLGVPGRIVVMGRSYGERLQAEMGGRVLVEVTGHLDEPEGVQRLRECFALYLNYPFGWRDAVLRQTSFPTKLSTYIQAARPLLLHVPPDSSVMPLVEYTGYAAHWGTMDWRDGSAALERLWADPAAEAVACAAAERVRRRYYDPERNRRTLFDILKALVSAGPGSCP